MLPSKSTPATIKITTVHVDAANQVNKELECKPTATMELARHISKQRWSIQDHKLAVDMLIPWMRLSAAHEYNKTTSTFTDQFWHYSTKAMAENKSTQVFVNGDVIMGISEDGPSPAVASLCEYQQHQPSDTFATNDTTSSSSMIQSSDPTQQSAHSLTSGGIVQQDIPSILSSPDQSSSTRKHNPVLPLLPPTLHIQSNNSNNNTTSPASFLQSISNLFTTKKEEEQEQPSSDYPIWIQHLHSKLAALVEDWKPGHHERTAHRHKIVIIGIHGWFPTKVNGITIQPDPVNNMHCIYL